MSQFNDAMTSKIIEAVIKVHQALGPGFIESVYHNALILELCRRGIQIDTEKWISIFYEGQIVGKHRLDLVVERQVIVEVKTVTALNNGSLRAGAFVLEGRGPQGRPSRQLLPR